MGICFGGCIKKSQSIPIHDFNKVEIPRGYIKIKLATYNVDIKNTVNLSKRIEEIITYLFSTYKNKAIDILCIQGIHDYSSAIKLVKAIKDYAEVNDHELYFAPITDNVGHGGSSSKISLAALGSKVKLKKNNSYTPSTRGSLLRRENGEVSKERKIECNKGKCKKEYKEECKEESDEETGSDEDMDEIVINITKARTPTKALSTDLRSFRKFKRSVSKSSKIRSQNIIISFFPIVNTIYAELNNTSKIEDILGTRTVIGANISIYGNIISVYNTELNRDIRQAHVLANNIRKREIRALFNTINLNKERISSMVKYVKTGVHFLTGSLNINEITGNMLNEEFNSFIQKYHCVDIYRHTHDEEPGYTNLTNERFEYILHLLADDLYKLGSASFKRLQSLSSTDELFQFIFDIYCIYFLDICVRTDILTSRSMPNYPVECVFMMDKQNH